jgi:DNA-binding NarL/FixJ family response regulator
MTRVVTPPIVEVGDCVYGAFMSIEVDGFVATVDVVVPKTHRIRIIIVERHRLDGDALEALLSRQDDMLVVRTLTYADASTAWRTPLEADVAICDFRSDVNAVASAAIELRRHGWRQPLIVLTDVEDDNVVRAAIDAEASAIVSRYQPAEDLMKVVRQAYEGVTLLSPERVASMIRSERHRHNLEGRLTRREAQVLALLANGASSRDIATSLRISYLTVRTHVRNLEAKLAARSQLEAVAKAYRLDLIHGAGSTSDHGRFPLPVGG